MREKIGGYNLLHKVGEGSHGSLFKAQKNGNSFAIKLFHPNAPNEVLQEGRRLAGLSHPHLVAFVEEGCEGKSSYLVTEWLEGASLSETPFPRNFSPLLRVTHGILEALSYLHAKGLIHGDLKSANTLVSDESVKLIDLGLSRSQKEDPETAGPGGTLAYLAPELLLGKPGSSQSDLYALGVILYRWMAGTYPFSSASVPSVIRWHLFELPSRPSPPPGDFPAGFGDFILRLLSKNPADRFASASQAKDWLVKNFERKGESLALSLAEEGEAEEGEAFELHGEAIRYYENKEHLSPEETLLLAELRFFQGHLSGALPAIEGREDREALLLKAKILTRLGDFTSAETLLKKIPVPEADAGDKGPQPSNRFVLSYLSTRGILYFYLGRLESALMSFSKAEGLAIASGEIARLASTYNSMANVMLEKGWSDAAEKYFLKSIQLAQDAQDPIHEGMFQMSLGYYYHRRQQFPEALKAYDKSAALLASLGQKTEWARVLLNRANLRMILGDLTEAERDFKNAREIFSKRSLSYLLAYSFLIEGEILRRKSRVDEALTCFQTAEERLTRMSRPADALWARLHAIECSIEKREFAPASDGLETLRSQALTAEPQARGHYYFLKARVFWGLGKSMAEVDPLFSFALRELKEAGDEEALILLYYAWGAFHHRLNSKTKAREYLLKSKEGIEVFSNRLPSEMRETFLKLSPCEALERMLQSMETLYLPVDNGSQTAQAGTIDRVLKSLENELAGELDLASLVEKVLDRMIELTEAERGFILLNEEPEPVIAVARKIDHRSVDDAEGKISESIARQVLQTGEPVMTVDALADQRFTVTSSVHRFKLRSVLCLPFRKRDKVLGAIYLDNRERAGVFKPSLAEELKPFAEFIAQALKNARRFSEVQSVLKETEKRLARAEAELKIKYDYRNLVGRHPKMLEVFKILDRVTDVEVPVLILGESGAGKELVAKAIHYHGKRSEKPFISLNCQAIPEGLFESELFGHSKGSFTGALSDRMGLIEQAHRGTLFLDEIGDMPLSLQGKLLRVLQEGKFRRVGEREERPVDCRVMAATHRDLKSMIQAGKFREDLWFRLNVVELRIPPLRDRLEDLPLLIDHFLGEFSKRHGGTKMRIAPEAIALLSRHRWPGNVRELENTITNACVFCESDTLNRDSFRYKREIFETVETASSAEAASPANVSRSFREAMQDFEKALLTQALKEAEGNITRAAIRLKIARPQLSRMVKKYKII